MTRIRLEYLSKDPIGFGAGDANLYRYVGNGPTNATDPSGLDGEYLGPSMSEAPPWYKQWWYNIQGRYAQRRSLVIDPRDPNQGSGYGVWGWTWRNLYHRTPIGDVIDGTAGCVRIQQDPFGEGKRVIKGVGQAIVMLPHLPEIWSEIPDYQKQDIGIKSMIGIATGRPFVKQLWPRKVIVKPSKWDYFFGRVKSSKHNRDRSLQNASDLKRLGIRESLDGRRALLDIFEEGRTLSECSRRTTEFGTTITRRVEFSDVGAIDIRYFYPGGNLNAKPEIPSIIPKIYR